MEKYYRDGNNVVCYDEIAQKIVATIPIFEEDGKTFTEEFKKIAQKMNSKEQPKKKEAIPVVSEEEVEVIPPERVSVEPAVKPAPEVEEAEKPELMLVPEKEYKVVKEEKANDKLKQKAKRLLTGGILTAAIIFGCVAHLKGCSKDDATEAFKTTDVTTEQAYEEDEQLETTIDDLKADSRYTTISEEDLVNTTQALMTEFSKKGINLNSEDALIFVTVANITHLQKTNPELLVKVLGENAEAENVIAKAYSIMGNIITLYVSPKQVKDVDWTLAFINEQDKQIADFYVDQVLNGSLEIAYDDTMSHADKKTKIQNNIINNYVIPVYDNTAAYTKEDGTKFYGPQEDGAEFISTIIMSAILQPDFGTLIKENTKQPAFIEGEVLDDINEILKNANTSPVIMRIIEGCNTTGETTTGVRAK